MTTNSNQRSCGTDRCATKISHVLVLLRGRQELDGNGRVGENAGTRSLYQQRVSTRLTQET